MAENSHYPWFTASICLQSDFFSRAPVILMPRQRPFSKLGNRRRRHIGGILPMIVIGEH
jgi:hypothetical protein